MQKSRGGNMRRGLDKQQRDQEKPQWNKWEVKLIMSSGLPVVHSKSQKFNKFSELRLTEP